MTKLSDTQLVILSNACQRDDRLVLPLPDRIKGGAATKVVASMIAKGLVEEVPAALDQPVWRESDDDRRLTLVATDAAFEALGIAPEHAPQGADEAPGAPGSESGAGDAARSDPAAANDAPVAPTAPARRTREGSKQGRLIEMLKAPGGATIAEIAEHLGWLPHTTRAAISTQTRKAGLAITSEKVEGRGRVYRAA